MGGQHSQENQYSQINYLKKSVESKKSFKPIELISRDSLKNTDIIIDDKLIAKFLTIQAQIEAFDHNSVFERLRIAEEEFELIEKNKLQAEINFKLLTEQCKKEKQDFENISSQTVQNYFKNKKDHDKAISKEQYEYLHSLNLVEIAQNELKSISQQYNCLKEKITLYKIENRHVIELYNEQMSILYSTFEGDYGSELENKLEREVHALAEKKETLRTALNKWRNGNFLLIYAYNQIAYSEQRWREMMDENIKLPEKVISATEVRNNLVAAYQNLINLRKYLKRVDLPYCTETDLKTLHNLASRTYEDMINVDRQRYCLSIIEILRRRCASLNQWFEQVIQTILLRDYSLIKAQFDQKSNDLKCERIKILQEKIVEKTGKLVDLNLFKITLEENRYSETILSTAGFMNSTEGSSGMTHSKSLEILEKPLSDLELLPPPTKEQILGDVEQTKRVNRTQTDNWNKEANKIYQIESSRASFSRRIVKKNSI